MKYKSKDILEEIERDLIIWILNLIIQKIIHHIRAELAKFHIVWMKFSFSNGKNWNFPENNR